MDKSIQFPNGTELRVGDAAEKDGKIEGKVKPEQLAGIDPQSYKFIRVEGTAMIIAINVEATNCITDILGDLATTNSSGTAPAITFESVLQNSSKTREYFENKFGEFTEEQWKEFQTVLTRVQKIESSQITPKDIEIILVGSAAAIRQGCSCLELRVGSYRSIEESFPSNNTLYFYLLYKLADTIAQLPQQPDYPFPSFFSNTDIMMTGAVTDIFNNIRRQGITELSDEYKEKCLAIFIKFFREAFEEFQKGSFDFSKHIELSKKLQKELAKEVQDQITTPLLASKNSTTAIAKN